MPTSTSTPQVNAANLFHFAHDLAYGTYTSAHYAEFQALLAHFWFWVVVGGYAIAAVAFFVVVYTTRNIFRLRERESKYYDTVILAPETEGGMNPRWQHIQSLISGIGASEWRAAIIEADIMLDAMLTEQGYAGEGVGEKLKNVERSDFNTLQDAWEAHKVRNQIAHEGSSFDLSETLTRRTIAHYEAVFREFKII